MKLLLIWQPSIRIPGFEKIILPVIRSMPDGWLGIDTGNMCEEIMSAFRIPRSMLLFGDDNETTPTR